MVMNMISFGNQNIIMSKYLIFVVLNIIFIFTGVFRKMILSESTQPLKARLSIMLYKILKIKID